MFDKSCDYGEKLKRLQLYVCQTFGKHFSFFADNFTGSKDTEPYKTDVSFFYVSIYTTGASNFSQWNYMQ